MMLTENTCYQSAMHHGNWAMVSVESFLSPPPRLMYSSTSSADTSTQLLFYHTTHITLLRPFHVAAGSAN